MVEIYVELAERYGLALVSTRRIVPAEDSARAVRGPHYVRETSPGEIDAVLQDIHPFSPEVSRVDLYTVHVMLALRKLDSSQAYGK